MRTWIEFSLNYFILNICLIFNFTSTFQMIFFDQKDTIYKLFYFNFAKWYA